jgi:hypothetical protein
MFAICLTRDVEGKGRELHRSSVEYTYAPPWREMTSTELLQATRHQLPLSNFALASAKFCPFYDTLHSLSYQSLGNTRPSNCFRIRMRSIRLQLVYLELYSPPS